MMLRALRAIRQGTLRTSDVRSAAIMARMTVWKGQRQKTLSKVKNVGKCNASWMLSSTFSVPSPTPRKRLMPAATYGQHPGLRQHAHPGADPPCRDT